MTGLPDRSALEELYARHHRLENLDPDPLVLARCYTAPEEGEVAGLFAAAFAYGQVGKIIQALRRIFEALGEHPRERVTGGNLVGLAHELEGFKYRFHNGRDVVLLAHLVGQVVERLGSLRALFLAGDPGGDIGRALVAFSEGILAGDPRPFLRTKEIPRDHPVRFLVASPSRGGAAKRLCLYLRWMVRRDDIDPGHWHGSVDPARLVIPLDTHVARVGRHFGFTRRAAADWKAAIEITAHLRRYDPRDPIRYDFSLFRFGMERGGRVASSPRKPRISKGA